jgi:hypothetical protein
LTPTASVLYKIFKTKFTLRYSTHATLLDIHGLARQANTWFMAHGLHLEFQLVEQADLEKILGLQAHPMLGLPANSRDIRQWLEWRGDGDLKTGTEADIQAPP